MSQTISPRRIIVGAVATVLERAPTLVRALAGPICVSLLLALAPNPETPDLTLALLGIVSLLVHTWIAVTSHRIVLLGENAVPKWGLTAWTQRETRFTLHLLAMFAATIVISLPLSLVPVIGPAILVVAIIVGFSSLSLVFPAIAMDEPLSFSGAWQMAQGHLFPLIICVCLFPFVIGLSLLLLSQQPYMGLVSGVLQLCMTVLTISVLSIAYLEIRNSKTSIE